jgi:4-amino-4-deoxy-L-arabinose transferase-like glycosyltransferase
LTDAVRAIAGRVVRSWAVPGFALALAPAGAWAWLLGRRLGPGAAREFVWVNNVLRFIGGAEGKGHEQPFHYYAPTLIVEFMPWSLILPAAIAAAGIAVRRAGRDAAPAGRPDAPDGDRRDTLRYLLAWFCVPIVVLSIASTKRGIYLLPIYPAAALLIGWYVSRPAGKGVGRAGRVALGFLFAGTLLIVAGMVVAQTWVGWRPAIGVPFVLVALLVVPIALRALQDGRAVRCALLCATLAGAALLVAVMRLVPEVVGRAASARPIATAVRGHVDQGDRLAFYDFPQGQMGGILFYAGLTLPNLRTPEEVDRFLAGDGGAFVLMREYDRDSVIPRLAVPVVVARRFDPSIQTPRRRPGGAILLLARAGIEDNAAGATGRTPP